AQVALVDANADALEDLASRLKGSHAIPGNLSSQAGCSEAIKNSIDAMGGVDVLINLAGLMSFCTYEDESLDRVQLLMQVNLIAPMLLSRVVLPELLAQGKGQIVNVGSMFGSIGFPYFTAYSASKFGLRGFSQALRRELADAPVEVTYVSPRAVKTPINTGPIVEMNKVTKANVDEPELIAGKIFEAIEAGKKEAYFGFPEAIFARLNGVLPGLIDNATKAQNRIARTFAKPGS
ncbi:MAG: SDR family NAD(P)-dependent oxidoreductase, partial [Halieaceae bacterium]|nr:SDR family NAD(P)-dependent oxidoreductase [Halieaceae bacterium]